MKANELQSVIILLKIAGYHDDVETFCRLYARYKVPMSEASLAYEQGGAMRKNGVPCHCHQCTEIKIREEITHDQNTTA